MMDGWGTKGQIKEGLGAIGAGAPNPYTNQIKSSPEVEPVKWKAKQGIFGSLVQNRKNWR
jgi:hypothetical protein